MHMTLDGMQVKTKAKSNLTIQFTHSEKEKKKLEAHILIEYIVNLSFVHRSPLIGEKELYSVQH